MSNPNEIHTLRAVVAEAPAQCHGDRPVQLDKLYSAIDQLVADLQAGAAELAEHAREAKP